MRRLLTALALGAAAALAGCNDIGGSLAVAPEAGAPPTPAPASFTLPPGRACSDQIGRYQEVVGRDVQTGNLSQVVYGQIEAELTRAAAACTAGRDNEAASLVRASQAKHGYHA